MGSFLISIVIITFSKWTLFHGTPFIGAARSYTESFQAIRSSRLERYAAETNKLLIRLDKLLVDLPADPVKRKGM